MDLVVVSQIAALRGQNIMPPRLCENEVLKRTATRASKGSYTAYYFVLQLRFVLPNDSIIYCFLRTLYLPTLDLKYAKYTYYNLYLLKRLDLEEYYTILFTNKVKNILQQAHKSS